MSGSIIKIKRSSGSAKPSTLKLGELALTYGTGTYADFGDRLLIGSNGVDVNGDAQRIDVVGGKFFTDRLDHQEGVLTADSAIVVDSNKKINELLVDSLKLDGSSIISEGTGAEASINITPNVANSGVINLNGPVFLQGDELTISGQTEISNTAIIADLSVTDLTQDRVVYVGANGAIIDSANLTFTGTVLTANAEVAINNGNTVINSTNVDINANTTIDGSSVAITAGTTAITANTTVTGTTFGVTANTTIDGTADVNGNFTVSTNIDANTAARGFTLLVQDSLITSYADIIPDIDSGGGDGRSLGSPTAKWKDLYVSGGTVYIDDIELRESTLGGTLEVYGANNSAITLEVDTIDVNTAFIGGVEFSGDSLTANSITITSQTANVDITSAAFLNVNVADDIYFASSSNTFAIDVGGARVTNAADPDPTSNTDLVTLGYLRGSGFSISADTGTDDAVFLFNNTIKFSGNTGITTSVSDNQIDIDLDDTTVTPGTYGNTTVIPVFTVDQQGRLTDANTVNIATDLTVSADQDATGNTADPTTVISLLNDTLDFIGGTGLTSIIGTDAVTFRLDDTAVAANSYGGSYKSLSITVDQQGRLTAASEQTVKLDISADTGTQTFNHDGNTLAFTGGTGVDTEVSNNVITFAIGQDVGTTANVQFNDVTVDGTLYSNDITANTVTIAGNLIVTGNTTTVNTEEINLADNVIVLNSNLLANTAPSQDSGININRGSETSARFFWDETNDYWTTSDGNGALAQLEAVIDGGTF